jgi:dihydroxyacetone kinase-like protein
MRPVGLAGKSRAESIKKKARRHQEVRRTPRPRVLAGSDDARSRCSTQGGRLSSVEVSTSPSLAGQAVVDPVIDATAVRAALHRCRTVVERHAAHLTRLDAVLGDGDHGDNLLIGFRSVEAMLEGLPADTPPGELLRAVGHRLVAAVGGASGPLYGTAFLEAGAAAGDAATIPASAVGPMLGAAADGLARRGRCTVGDKTILDALQPAADELVRAIDRGDPPGAAWVGAVRAAVRVMRSTRPLIARRGLALRLGDRSIGHLDPGAVSCTLLLRAIADG